MPTSIIGISTFLCKYRFQIVEVKRASEMYEDTGINSLLQTEIYLNSEPTNIQCRSVVRDTQLCLIDADWLSTSLLPFLRQGYPYLQKIII